MFGSLAASIYAVAVFPGAAFYFLPSRAWELLIGSILALIPAGWILSNRLARETVTSAGLACIAAPCLFYTKDTPFPGLAAVIPCAGTAAIIWANTVGSSGMGLTTVGALLAWRPLVFLGLISYSLYLWHWPLLVFSNYWSLGPLSLSNRLGLLALALLLAIVSWRFVETPIRRRAMFEVVAVAFISLYALVIVKEVACSVHGELASVNLQRTHMMGRMTVQHIDRSQVDQHVSEPNLFLGDVESPIAAPVDGEIPRSSGRL